MMLTLLLASSAAAAAPPTSSCAPGACTGTVVRVGPAPLQCERIQQAFNCIPDRTANAPRVHVLVTPGTYPEALRLHASKGPVSLLGLGNPHTVTVAANETCGGSDPTVPCGALQVLADDFVMSNITLANEVESIARGCWARTTRSSPDGTASTSATPGSTAPPTSTLVRVRPCTSAAR